MRKVSGKQRLMKVAIGFTELGELNESAISILHGSTGGSELN